MSYSMLYESPVQNLELISDGEALTHVLYKYNDTTVTHPTNPDLDIFKKVVEWLNEQLKTYGDLANLVGEERNKPNMSAQAIGGAVGSNPISIIIPCHRVVGKDGSLTGYGGTINHKIKLLELEQVDMNNLYRPKNSTKP